MTELFLIESASVITNLFSGNPFCLLFVPFCFVLVIDKVLLCSLAWS